MEDLWLASYVVLWFIVLSLLVIVLLLLRQFGLMFLNIGPDETDEGLPVGSIAPRFTAADIDGNEHSVGPDRPPVALVFVSPACSACKTILPKVAAVAGTDGRTPRMLLVNIGDDWRQAAKFAAGLGVTIPVLSGGGVLGPEYKVRRIPFGYFIETDGTIARKGLINTEDKLRTLVYGEEVMSQDEEVSPQNSEMGGQLIDVDDLRQVRTG